MIFGVIVLCTVEVVVVVHGSGRLCQHTALLRMEFQLTIVCGPLCRNVATRILACHGGVAGRAIAGKRLACKNCEQSAETVRGQHDER